MSKEGEEDLVDPKNIPKDEDGHHFSTVRARLPPPSQMKEGENVIDPHNPENWRYDFVLSSSAAAGSGEFHTYQIKKRRELKRLEQIEADWEQQTKQKEFEAEKKRKREELEQKIAKKRAKRQKLKEKQKAKREQETREKEEAKLTDEQKAEIEKLKKQHQQTTTIIEEEI
eukprot:GCRY01002643.1.p1 GENE.GCRY01002643.1~~GCRY01002643.1.p1  ORF type:complete len:171 (+),score=43.24 GCRY01002643.1:173-685(+)